MYTEVEHRNICNDSLLPCPTDKRLVLASVNVVLEVALENVSCL
jgi:hypothetical protein